MRKQGRNKERTTKIRRKREEEERKKKDPTDTDRDEKEWVESGTSGDDISDFGSDEVQDDSDIKKGTFLRGEI